MATSPRVRMARHELDTFLREERILHLATIDAAGWPAVVPVWFIWHDRCFWVSNLDRAERTERLHAGDTRVGVCVDGGTDYAELRGVTARVAHEFVPVQNVPRGVTAEMGRKYFGREDAVEETRGHTWLRLQPLELQTWDFRKLGTSQGPT